MLYYIKTIQARKIFLLWSFDTPQFALMCVLWSLPVLICNYWCAEFCASIIENLLVLHVNVRLARPVALTLCIDPFTDRELFRILPTLEDIGNFFRKIYFWTIYATNTSNICFNMLNLTIKYIWVKVLAILALKNKVLVNFIYQLFFAFAILNLAYPWKSLRPHKSCNKQAPDLQNMSSSRGKLIAVIGDEVSATRT